MHRGPRLPQALVAASLVVIAACTLPDNPPAGTAAQVEGAVNRVSIGDGIELAYVERGSGPTVVLVHGSLADLSYWEQSEQMERLAAGFRVIAYSRRYNHPSSNPPSGDHSPMVEARDLDRLLTALRTGPVHLVGHSYGAYTALVYAMDHPGMVRSLVLAEPPIISWLPEIPGGEGVYEGFMASVWEPLAVAFRDGGDAEGLDFTARWYFDVPFAEVEPAWQTLFTDNVAEWRALAVSPHTFPHLDRDRVSGVRMPTLLLSGGRNEGGFNDLVDGHLQQLITGSERIVIPDASHEMFLDFPQITASLMARHFTRAEASR